MKMLKNLVLLLVLLLPLGFFPAQGQDGSREVTFEAAPAQTPGATAEVEMADRLREDGKIYIVVIVLLTVLAGVLFYLIRIDRKVSRLEREMRD